MAAQIVLGMFFVFNLALLPTFPLSESAEVRNGSPVDIEDMRWQLSNPGAIYHRKYRSRKKAKDYA